jgi:Protein of unknown function (DUF732)
MNDDTILAAEWVDLEAADTLLAWSQCGPALDYPTEPRHHRRWSTVVKIVSAAAAVVLGALAVAVLLNPPDHAQAVAPPPPPAVAVSAPTTEPVSTRLPVVPDAIQKLSPDDLLVELLQTNGSLTVDDREAAIRTAHAQCDYLAHGHSISETVTAMLTNYPSDDAGQTLQPRWASVFVMSAIQAYCPQFEGR